MLKDLNLRSIKTSNYSLVYAQCIGGNCLSDQWWLCLSGIHACHTATSRLVGSLLNVLWQHLVEFEQNYTNIVKEVTVKTASTEACTLMRALWLRYRIFILDFAHWP